MLPPPWLPPPPVPPARPSIFGRPAPVPLARSTRPAAPPAAPPAVPVAGAPVRRLLLPFAASAPLEPVTPPPAVPSFALVTRAPTRPGWRLLLPFAFALEFLVPVSLPTAAPPAAPPPINLAPPPSVNFGTLGRGRGRPFMVMGSCTLDLCARHPIQKWTATTKVRSGETDEPLVVEAGSSRRVGFQRLQSVGSS